ncbi:hypothetical protein ACOMHN_047834 [Nucella lapillus]
MGLGMRGALLVALAMLAMTSVVIVSAFRLGDKHRHINVIRQAKCLNYMEQCVPWDTLCCDGMTCTNFGKGFCMYGLEPCICQRPFTVDLA